MCQPNGSYDDPAGSTTPEQESKLIVQVVLHSTDLQLLMETECLAGGKCYVVPDSHGVVSARESDQPAAQHVTKHGPI